MQLHYLLILAMIPMCVALLLLMADRRRRKRAGEKSPLPEKLLRPAGHSLMLRLEDLSDDLSLWIFGSFLSPLAGAFVFSLPGTEAARWVALITSWLFAAGFAVLTLRISKKMRHCRLGLLGEQSVA